MISKSGRLVHIAIGFAAWAILFALIYGMQGVGCRLGWDNVLLGIFSLQRIQLIVLYLGGLGVLVLLYAWLSNEIRKPKDNATHSFIDGVSGYGALAAFAAASVSFVGVMWLTTC
jgi:hypothetical protein